VLKVRTGTTGVAPVVPRLSLRVTPNPVRGAVNVAFEVPDDVAGGVIEMFAMDGRRVRRESVSTGTGALHWRLNEGSTGLAPGVYWVRLRAGAMERTVRVALLE
jgi:hypothetical protein